MVSLVAVRPNERDVAAALSELDGLRGGAAIAVNRATNRTAEQCRTRIVDAVSGQVYLKKSVVREDVGLRKASYGNPAATITIKGKRVPLIDFNARETGKGVSYRISKAAARTTVPKGFIETMMSGHRGVFRRAKLGVAGNLPTAMANRFVKTGKLYGRVTSGRLRDYARVTKDGFAQRLPIQELRGPSVVGVYSKAPEIAERVLRETTDLFGKNLRDQVDLLTGGTDVGVRGYRTELRKFDRFARGAGGGG